ncbi:MAG: hypothetical protein HYR60_11590 [Acidobacteria bacterium]|nr:hypothetical protein [Acidobacteriota bacterium]
MKYFRLLVALAALAAIAYPLPKKKKKEEETQTLEVPKDPPAATTAETRRLVFHVTPLSGKGLLSQQVREALKALMKTAGSAQIVKLRAMVAGSGDLRRVPAIVSEVFTEKKLNLPVVSTVQVGGLPMEGAQVVLESTAMVRKEVNPHGLAWISGQQHSTDKPLEAVEPLARKSLDDLKTAVAAAGSHPSDVLRLTCFMSSLDGVNEVRGLIAADFAQAAVNLVQVQRAPARGVVECEAVARLRHAVAEPVRLVNPQGLPSSPNYSQLALIGARKIVLTGTQVSFGYQDADARLAFQRLDKVLREAGVSAKNVAMSSLYPLSTSLAEQVRRIRFEFYDPSHPPASTMLPFEGLPAMEAGFAVDVVAVVQ